MLAHAPFARFRTFRNYAIVVTLAWTVVLVLAAAGAIATRFSFLLVAFAAWAAGFALASLARARLPHPRARTTVWWPFEPPPPRTTPYHFPLHRGSYVLYAFCVGFGWLLAWVQVTIMRQATPHPNPRPAPWLDRGSI